MPVGITADGVQHREVAGELVVDLLAIKGKNSQWVTSGSGQSEIWNDETGNNANDHVVGAFGSPGERFVGPALGTVDIPTLDAAGLALLALLVSACAVTRLRRPNDAA